METSLIKTKIFKVKQTRNHGRQDRPDSITYYEGTLAYLVSCFSYTLAIGNSWNRKIDRNPKTINSFLKNLSKSYDEKEGACYSRTYVELDSTRTGFVNQRGEAIPEIKK